MLKKWLIICFTSLLLTQLYFCKKSTEPLGTGQSLKMEVVDVSCTEVWLGLEIKQSFLGKTLKLFRDDSLIISRDLMAADTLLLDDCLEPSQSYQYRMRLYNGNELSGQSAIVDATTMDTTSHDFEIKKFYFGGKGSSDLFGVQIVNENDIYAVGEIYTEDTYTYDSLGNWIDPYNAVHWDGEKWDLKRFYDYKESIILPIRDIHVFSKNDIWIVAGSILHWTGKLAQMSFRRNIGTFELAKYLWVKSENEFYATGSEGLIVYYNGQNWQRLESGTDATIQDIYGVYKNNESYILCPVSTLSKEIALLRIHSDNSISRQKWIYQNRTLLSVWFKDRHSVFFCGGGVHVRNRLGQYKEFTELPKIVTNHIRGQDINDIFVAGDFGLLAHYNGKSWRQYTKFDEVDVFLSIDYKDDLAVIVGFEGSQAVIYMLYKN